jgi:alkylation response protein AidB-like acyl-CoA dehydrogenase
MINQGKVIARSKTTKQSPERKPFCRSCWLRLLSAIFRHHTDTLAFRQVPKRISSHKGQGLKGLNFFLIEAGTPGLYVSKTFDKLGARATEISGLAFTDVCVPFENRLGKEGQGVGNLMRILAVIRVMTAALSLGLARGAYDHSRHYAMERTQFGKRIGSLQLVQQKIANMATDIWESRLMVYRAAAMIDNGERALKEASMAKYFVSEVACRAADEATRIFGAYSYSMKYDVQRFYRDCRFLLFGGGTAGFSSKGKARPQSPPQLFSRIHASLEEFL